MAELVRMSRRRFLASAAAAAAAAQSLLLEPGASGAAPKNALAIRESSDAIQIDTGVIVRKIPRVGSSLIQSITRDGNTVAANARVVALRQDSPTLDADQPVR